MTKAELFLKIIIFHTIYSALLTAFKILDYSGVFVEEEKSFLSSFFPTFLTFGFGTFTTGVPAMLTTFISVGLVAFYAYLLYEMVIPGK